jgi:hypothetical protein
MAPDTSGSRPGFERAERFESVQTFSEELRRVIPVLVVGCVLIGLIVGGILSLLIGPIGLLLGFIAAAALGFSLVTVRKWQFNADPPVTRLVVSPSSLVVSDRYLRTEFSWDGIEQIGPTSSMRPSHGSGGGGVFEGVVDMTAAATAVSRDDGLIGAGKLTVNPSAPHMLRQQVEQNDARLQVHPESGLPIRAVGLGKFEPDWRNGRIGQWVKAYRPDLFTDE